MRKVAGRFVQVAIGVLINTLSVEVIQLATRFEKIATGLSANRKLCQPLCVHL